MFHGASQGGRGSIMLRRPFFSRIFLTELLPDDRREFIHLLIGANGDP